MSARSLNKVLLIGNLTRDPELRYTPNGTAVCTFGLATNRSWTPNEGGERQEETEFHRIVAWSKLAEICSQLLYKGRKVFVEGRLQTRTWQAQDGQERTATEVVIDNMIALGAPKGGSTDDAYDYATEAAGMPAVAAAPVDDVTAVADEAVTPVVTDAGEAEQEKPAKPKVKKVKTAEPANTDVADDIPF